MSSLPMPEEMSVWAGLTVGPQLVRSLPPGEPFNHFCGLLIDAFRTVHRPFQELARLGHALCPFDWLDVLSINQVRALRQFLKVADGSDVGDPATWDIAWAQAPVPGFANVSALWQSDIGRALRERRRRTSVDIETIEDESSSQEGVLDRPNFVRHLCILIHRGVILEEEADLLIRLYDGEMLAALRTDTRVHALLRRRHLSWKGLIDDLERRLCQSSVKLGEGGEE